MDKITKQQIIELRAEITGLSEALESISELKREKELVLWDMQTKHKQEDDDD